MSFARSRMALLLADNGYGEGGAGSEFSLIAINLALIFTIVATCISMISVWLHWKNYRKPNQQRQVIRILWIVPIYGVSTFVSLVSLNVAFYVDTFRDMYEAYVIYAFFNLLLNKLGGERALIIMLHSRPPSENFFPGTLWSREIYVGDPYTFLFVKRGILQFVYVKPILAVVTMALKATGHYSEGEISWTSSYLYLTFFYNISVTLTLWCLMVFFYATKKDLVAFRPLPKFLCVKAIIFFSFWQSVVIALMVAAGMIQDEGPEHISVAIQDFLICMEMVPAAIAHSFSFSYEDYYDPDVHSARMPIYRAIRDSFGIKDVVMDTLDTLRGSQFNYRSFEPSEGVPHIGSSRTSRIMAGLRYSTSTAKKHWIDPAPTSRFISAGRALNEGRGGSGGGERGASGVEVYEPLEFDDPDPNDEVEDHYRTSRAMMFGDYNYPVIDFRIPLWKQVRGGGGYGGTGLRPGRYNSGSLDAKKKKGKYHQKAKKSGGLSPRGGCVDVVVEQGKGNFVVVEAVTDDDRDNNDYNDDDDDDYDYDTGSDPSVRSSRPLSTSGGAGGGGRSTINSAGHRKTPFKSNGPRSGLNTPARTPNHSRAPSPSRGPTSPRVNVFAAQPHAHSQYLQPQPQPQPQPKSQASERSNYLQPTLQHQPRASRSTPPVISVSQPPNVPSFVESPAPSLSYNQQQEDVPNSLPEQQTLQTYSRESAGEETWQWPDQSASTRVSSNQNNNNNNDNDMFLTGNVWK